MDKIQVKLNMPLQGFAVGRIINLEVDENGTVKDYFWRRRLQDSVIDNCVEIVEDKNTEVRKIKPTKVKRDKSSLVLDVKK